MKAPDPGARSLLGRVEVDLKMTPHFLSSLFEFLRAAGYTESATG